MVRFHLDDLKSKECACVKKNVLVCKSWFVRLSCCYGNGLKTMLGDLCGLLVNSSRILRSVLIIIRENWPVWYWNFFGSAIKKQTGGKLIESSFFS